MGFRRPFLWVLLDFYYMLCYNKFSWEGQLREKPHRSGAIQEGLQDEDAHQSNFSGVTALDLHSSVVM